ncbi:hypothetical protein F0562_010524 [Nyssa sinensis]|uniref:Uncharacterized protein n=1 Tax=Nyssa sinensis TaxID=561372 RepID=A0A5J4ZYX4_9ASTE|nr:hypothetical protein F0562_010524 [Nyssa sinensis]
MGPSLTEATKQKKKIMKSLSVLGLVRTAGAWSNGQGVSQFQPILGKTTGAQAGAARARPIQPGATSTSWGRAIARSQKVGARTTGATSGDGVRAYEATRGVGARAAALRARTVTLGARAATTV